MGKSKVKSIDYQGGFEDFVTCRLFAPSWTK